MIFAMEKVKFLHGVGEVTLSGGRLVGVSVAIVLPVENGCMVWPGNGNDRGQFILHGHLCFHAGCRAAWVSVRGNGRPLRLTPPICDFGDANFLALLAVSNRAVA